MSSPSLVRKGEGDVRLSLSRDSVRQMYVDMLSAVRMAEDHDPGNAYRYQRWADLLRTPALSGDPFEDGRDPIDRGAHG